MASRVEGQPSPGLPDGEKKSSYGGSLRAKPLITPKPFSLQRNTTLRPIHAPKTAVPSALSSPSRVSIKNLFPGATKPEPPAVLQSSPAVTDARPTRGSAVLKGKTEEGSASRPSDTPDSASVPKASVLPTPRPIERKTSPVSVPAVEPLTITKDDRTAPLTVSVKEQVIVSEGIAVNDEKKGPDTTFATATSDPTEPETHPVLGPPAPRDTTLPDAIQKSAVTLRRPKASTGEGQANTPLSPTSQDPPSKRGLARNRLSMELTSKFESGGQPLPSLHPHTTRGKYVGKLPTSAVEPEKINPTVIQQSSEKDAEVLKVEAEEDRTGGRSIKRRITLLFDSSSRPEVATKREEPPVVTQSNDTGGAVKDRIKNWAVETNADTDNILQPQTNAPTKNLDIIDLPEKENTTKKPLLTEISSEEAADVLPAVSSAAKPLDDPVETPQSTSPNEETPESSTDKSLEPVQGGSSDSAAVFSDPSSEEAHRANPLKDRTLRRSVRFGTVERDDGKPPVLLGSEPESSAEEEDLSEDEGRDGQTEEAIKMEKEKEREKHKEFMWQKQREEQREKVTRMEERLRENETFKEAERQKLRQREEEEEEAQKVRLKQKERELEEDRERVRRDEERLREERREKEKQIEEERLRKEERERESQREEERERQKKEERLRAEERERDRQREEERLKEEEKAKQRAEERLQAEERERERQREEEREKQRVKERSQAEEREKERQREEERFKEEEREKKRVEERSQAEERERERQREEERLKEEEREKKRVEERLQAEERERDREREEKRERQRVEETERQKEEERERQRVEERLRAEETERERKREEERLKEEERERQRVEDKLREEARERERRRDEERLKEEEKERQTLEERLKAEERERTRLEERLREEEKERQRVEERLREEAKERLRLEERLREQERERQKMEERLREEEGVQERLKKEEMERERQVEFMWQRQREEDRERARQKEERLREDERARDEARRREVEETERLEDQLRAEQREREAEKILAVKRERDRVIVEAEERERERQKQQRLREEQERERQTQEALDRKRAEELEVKLRETERRREEEERERERLQEEQEEQERIERQQQEEEERARERKEEAARRKQAEEEEVNRRQALLRSTEDTANLISFDSEDEGQKSESLLVEPTLRTERAENPLEVPFDDFSVKKPVAHVLFDDFSVTPRRWGSKSKVPQTPEPNSGLEDVWVRRAPDVDSQTHQAPQLDQGKERDVVPLPSISSLVPLLQEEPRRPYEIPAVEKKEAEVVEEDEDEVVHKEKEEEREEGVAELKDKWNEDWDGLDTEALLNNEREQQYEDRKHTDVSEPKAESPTPALEPHPDVHLDDWDGVDPRTEPELPAFPESSAPLLDNKALRSKAELRKRKSQRTRLPRTRLSSAGAFLAEDSASTPDWRASDNTEETAESDEDEKEKRGVKGPSTSQRTPVFPGLSSSHSALVAQLKKKTGGGGGGGAVETTPVKDKAAAAREDLAALTPSQSMRSPRSAACLPGAARVLPLMGGKDDGTGSSPSWLQELKKKRMSQQESGS